MYKTKILFLVIATIIIPLASFGQAIKLTNQEKSKSMIFSTGDRVSGTTSDDDFIGQIVSISTDSIQIDDRKFAINELTSFGQKKKGSGIGSFLLAALGGAFIGSALAPEKDPCPSCQTVSTEDNGGSAGDAILIVGGAVLAGLAIHTASKNSPKDLKEGTWSIEVIE
ncbi:MAG: DUF6232 family protein [Fulvivirga sp.]|nr:DUF6232 family protein [Fulvivirga sp.]